MTNRRREIGVAVAWTKSDSTYCLHPSHYNDLKAAWMAGRAFYQGTTLHGDEIVVKLGTVESIQLFTREGQQAQRDEEIADKEDDAPLSFT